MTIMQQNTPHNSRSTKLDMLKNPLLVAFILIVLLLAAGEALSPGFASMEQILRLLIVAALLGIVAAGQNLVILGGREGIDLSVGGVVSLSAVLAGNVMDGSNANIIAAILVCLAAGGLVGLINGVGVTLFGIPPLVMTLGMLGCCRVCSWSFGRVFHPGWPLRHWRVSYPSRSF